MTDEISNTEEEIVEPVEGEIVYSEPPAEDLVEVAPEDEVPEEYQPNLTYKIRDEEHTFDEMFNGAIINKESEDALRDLYTKAGGLDSYKEKVTGYETRLEEQTSQLTGFRDGFETIRKHRDEGNHRRLFQSIGLDDKTVMEYALKVAQEEELPEEQRRVINENRQYKDRLDAVELQMNTQKQDNYERATQNDLQELNGYLETNKSLDTAMKSAGYNLGDEIIHYGLSAQKATGKEPSIAEATQAVVQKYNKLMSLNQPAANETNLQQRINNRPDTLPTVRGTNQTAPTESFTSIDQLRKLASTFA